MYSGIAERLIYPLGDLALGTSVVRYYHWLQKTQWWSSEQLRELQNAKLRTLIKHAYEKVPYYRRVFGEIGLTHWDIQTVDDLPKLPILLKDDIRQNFENMKAQDFAKHRPILDYTGGSTGEPLKYYITKDLASIGWAGMFRGWGWAGYRLGDKRVSFGGSSLVPRKRVKTFEIVRRRLERNLALSAVSMSDAKYRDYLKVIRSYRPRFVYGYASSIYLLADYCRAQSMNDIRFNAVFCTAEVLLQSYRDAIESQFQCRVFDQYGAYDGGAQALECPVHQGFHITAEKVVLETVDGDGRRLPSGKPGRIIATDLHNYAMPFVRYETGDVGTLDDKPCICGRSLPILQSVEGRTTDIIRLSNGTILAGPAVTLIMKDCRVRQYQLVQDARDSLVMRVVKAQGYSELDSNHVLGLLRHHAGTGVDVRLEFLDQIPVVPNGKYRFILSNV